MTDNRNLFEQMTAAGMMSDIPAESFPQPDNQVKETSKEPKMWAVLLHLSVNMWGEYYSSMRFDESLWNDALKKMVEQGLTTVVIDLGDGVLYNSHPEITVKNAWTTGKLQDELGKIRAMGLEPIPKLNFSTCHDGWLKDYGRMISTDIYYAVCRDLITEVSNLFGKPRFFHLGLDEENESNQRNFDYQVIRHGNLYWGDIYFLIGEVFKNGCRPWVWQDYIRYFHDEVARMMPKSVLQSNWYNLTDFDKPQTNKSVKAYVDLEALGFDQVPGGSNYYEKTEKCFFNNVKFCAENVADERIIGFIQSPWKHTLEENRERILLSIEQAGEAKKWFERRSR